jgi:translation elongation factor EF-Tu-like GTPase
VTTTRFDFSATVVVLSEAEGGRRTPAHAGIRWDLAATPS